MIILSFIVLLTIIYGFMDGGSPQAARNNRFDNTRIQDIKTIKNWVGSYYRVKKLLPATILDAYTNYNNTYTKIPSDPETNIGYEYQILTRKEYKICATYSTNTIGSNPQYLAEYSHPSGFHCLTFSGDKY